jgi:hypothetical protein
MGPRKEENTLKLSITRALCLGLALALPAAVLAQGAPRMTERAPERAEVEVKGHYLPAMAGIESAEAATRALQQLSMSPALDPRQARATAELADEGMDVARASTNRLASLVTLSPEARDDAESAALQLERAHATLETIQSEVGGVQGRLRRDEAEEVRDLSSKLYGELRAARGDMKKVAGAQRISTDVEMREKDGKRAVPIRR